MLSKHLSDRKSKWNSTSVVSLFGSYTMPDWPTFVHSSTCEQTINHLFSKHWTFETLIESWCCFALQWTLTDILDNNYCSQIRINRPGMQNSIWLIPEDRSFIGTLKLKFCRLQLHLFAPYMRINFCFISVFPFPNIVLVTGEMPNQYLFCFVFIKCPSRTITAKCI